MVLMRETGGLKGILSVVFSLLSLALGDPPTLLADDSQSVIYTT